MVNHGFRGYILMIVDFKKEIVSDRKGKNQSLLIWVKGALVLIMLAGFCLGDASAETGFQKVRFARADVDGDGVSEVVAGGRIGPAVSVDVPRAVRQAGFGVYQVSGKLLKPLAVREDLQSVQDVGAGDLDGDGKDEIITVGMGRLTVFGWRQDGLSEMSRVSLGGAWTDRVAVGDVDQDGRAEIAVTIYQIEAEAEIGHTRVVIYRWQDALVRGHDWITRMHVGDLAANASGWVMEVGAGEEGGELMAVNKEGWPVWQHSVASGPRALSLDVIDQRLIVGRVDGVVHLYDLETSQPRLLNQSRVPFLAGLLFAPGHRGKTLMIGSYRAGISWLEF